MNTGLIAIIIILVVIVGAIATRRCMEFLIGGSIVAALVLYGGDFLTQWCAMLQKSKGTFGFSALVEKFCTNQRRTLLTTFIMGILIFVDDYLNVLTVGVCMKNVSDKRRLPRESLAYMLDATGAADCVLLPFSTWAVFYSTLFWEQSSVQELGYGSAMSAYMHAGAPVLLPDPDAADRPPVRSWHYAEAGRP